MVLLETGVSVSCRGVGELLAVSGGRNWQRTPGSVHAPSPQCFPMLGLATGSALRPKGLGSGEVPGRG